MNWLRSLRSQPATCVGTTSWNCFSLVAFLVVFSIFSLAQEVQVYVSSRAGDRIALKPSLHFGQGGSPTEFKFEINDSVPYQKIDGFGASLLEAGLICINDLPPDEQEKVLRSLFDPKDGAGFSAMKTELASTDFQSADQAIARRLECFLARDRVARHVIGDSDQHRIRLRTNVARECGHARVSLHQARSSVWPLCPASAVRLSP